MDKNVLINMLAASKMRREMLLYLDGSQKTPSEIRDYLGVSAPQLSIKIRELQGYNLIHAEGKAYSLTAQGKILLENYLPFANTVDLFERHGEYWKTHDLNCIPEELQHRLGELHDTEYIRDDTEDLNRTLSSLLKIMSEAKQIAGASPIFDEIVVSGLVEKARQGTPIEMIVSSTISDRMTRENMEIVEELTSHPNYRFFITDMDIRTPFILTDRYFFFSDYYIDGTFDTQSNLVGSDPAALKWGRDLLEYYKARSVKV